jgi:hypothetical protein
VARTEARRESRRRLHDSSYFVSNDMRVNLRRALHR